MVSYDRWGKLYNLTGFEARNHCSWCGVEVKNRRYCGAVHSYDYAVHFRWPEASSAALKRAGGKCADCAKEAKSASELRVHHMQPLDGGLRGWNILNRPENLVVLCPSCHGKRHAELNSTRRLKRPERQLRAGQMELGV
jgi:5-methylcytosine-specific restriction endonuclease McrA